MRRQITNPNQKIILSPTETSSNHLKLRTFLSTRALSSIKNVPVQKIQNAWLARNKKWNKVSLSTTMTRRINPSWLPKFSKWNLHKIKKESERETFTWLFLDKEAKVKFKEYNSTIRTKGTKIIWKEKINKQR